LSVDAVARPGMIGVNVSVNPPPVMATAEVPSVRILTRTHLRMSGPSRPEIV
jgi:hypothetical protein